MTLCLATKYDNPTDAYPMICALGLDHEGDHRPAGFSGGVWTTWSDEEAAS